MFRQKADTRRVRCDMLTGARFIVKTFEELTSPELYSILKIRSEVFVMEQNCVCLDPDGEDIRALHVMLTDGAENVLAYLRLYPKDDEPGVVHMGRVLTAENRRGEGLGLRTVKEGMLAAVERMGAKQIYIEAQTCATGFYERAGFKVCSDVFDDHGIPHVTMRSGAVFA